MPKGVQGFQAGTAAAREAASRGGHARVANTASRRIDRTISDLIAMAPELTERQRARLAWAFGERSESSGSTRQDAAS